MHSDTSSIPITVFTGFLGAGKTSVILSLLPKLPPGYKAVLLKNEYGDIEGGLSLDLCKGDRIHFS
jgi:G3E family GTPase